jgi:hypothetical protein
VPDTLPATIAVRRWVDAEVCFALALDETVAVIWTVMELGCSDPLVSELDAELAVVDELCAPDVSIEPGPPLGPTRNVVVAFDALLGPLTGVTADTPSSKLPML